MSIGAASSSTATSTTTGTTSTTASATSGSGALGSLSGNFNDFLKLLMTQLKNQDPTSPTDTNQFTQQLVQFASVEQQINTNSSLTKLIEATQGNTLLQASALVGKQVSVASDQLALQNGKGSIQFSATAPGTVAVGVYSQAGVKLRDETVSAVAGTNTWTWNGKGADGRAMPDGAYKVAVAGADGKAVPFTVLATATGVQKSNGAMKVSLGTTAVSFSDVQSVDNR